MTKYVATKSFAGREGSVRRGQFMPDGMTEERIKQLERGGLIEPYRDGMAAAPRNQMAPGAYSDRGTMTAQNAGGIVDLGWNPDAGKAPPAGENAQDGSETSPIASSSLSPEAQAQPTSTSSTLPGGRRPRGQRPSSS